MLLDRNSFAAALAHQRGFVVIAPDVALIPLQRRNSPTGEFAVVSRDDRALGRFYWSKNPWGYARRRDADGRTILLHREVMGCTLDDGQIVDHINRDKLDCRRSNLRLVTQAQNAQNQGARHLTSRYRGVSYQKRSRKWIVSHKLKGVQHNLGGFDTEEEAAAVALAWRKENMPFAGDTSQHRGVSWDASRGKWKATARLDYKLIALGRFDTEAEAAEVARAWRAEHMPHATD